MSKLVWDQPGEKLFETGVKDVVLYLMGDGDSDSETAKHPKEQDSDYTAGVAWNGVTSIQESPSGADANDIYADNAKYLSIRAAETFGATIEAYMSPEEFDECDGLASPVAGVVLGQQARSTFGLCYRTEVGSDEDTSTGKNYKLHFVYGLTASPSSRQYQTINESPEAMSLSWELASTPIDIGEINGAEYKKLSTVVVDTTKLTTDTQKAALATLREWIYGTDETAGEGGTTIPGTNARLPKPSAIIDLFDPSAAG